MTAFAKPKPTYVQTIIIFSLVLFLIGLYLIITTHAGNIGKILKENLNIVIELQDDIPEPEKVLMVDKLKQDERIIPSSVTLVSKETAIEIMKEEIGESLLLTGEENPFFDIVKMNVKFNFQDKQSIDSLLVDLKTDSKVIDAYFYENIYEGIETTLRRVSYLALVSGILFVILAYSLMHSTVNIALYADRKEIKTMEMVGAEWTFIRKPYLKRSLFIGLISSGLAILILSGLLLFIHLKLYSLNILIQMEALILVFIILFGIGIAFSYISTHFALKKYLRPSNEMIE